MKVSYNIISYGTEKQSQSKGYMAISEKIKGCRFIMPLEHSICEYDIPPEGSLKVSADIDIKKIALARFLLMPYLFFERQNFDKNCRTLIFGCGCVGTATCLYLVYKKFTNLYYTTSSSQPIDNVCYVKKDNINFEDYDLIVETTGNAQVLQNILISCKPFSSIVLLGTVRDTVAVDFLTIHRKNLKIFGAHELCGYTNEFRQKAFDKICQFMKNDEIASKEMLSKLVCVSENKERKSVYTIVRKSR